MQFILSSVITPILVVVIFFMGTVANGASYSRPNEMPLWAGEAPVHSVRGGRESFVDERVYNVRNPALYPFLISTDSPKPAVVIFPGGGYQKLSIVKEGEEAAVWLNGLGVQAFVVKTRLQQFGAPAPLLDAQQAMRLVRENAVVWGVDPTRVGVLGFSAGGHLAATISQRFDALFAASQKSSLLTISARPDFTILIYPVITMRSPWAHPGSREALLGSSPKPEAVSYYSFDNNLRANSPKALLIHSAKDESVAVENSVQYWQALQALGIHSELHVFQEGGHGFGLRDEHNPIGQWPKIAEAWLRSNGVIAADSAPLVEPILEVNALITASSNGNNSVELQ